MMDPFLYEAIEGYDSVSGDHAEQLRNIQNRLGNNRIKSINRRLWQSAAASVILLFGLGGYLLTDYHKSNLHAQAPSSDVIIDIYVPKAYYTENIATIAHRNSEVARSYKAEVPRFEIDRKQNTSLGEEEYKLLEESSKAENLIDIYIPEDFSKQTADTESAGNGKPEPIGGFNKYELYLKNSMRRPTDDACRNRKGKVVVEFSVNEAGQPYLFDVKQSICGTSDNEAIRLIQSGPKWTVGSGRATVRVLF